MAEAMEEYEKEAGCVPILHPEVGSSASTPRAHNRTRSGRVRSFLVRGGLFWFSRLHTPAARSGGGRRHPASDAKGASTSFPPAAGSANPGQMQVFWLTSGWGVLLLRGLTGRLVHGETP